STWQGPKNVTPGQPDSGIAASSLLDANSLPQWMREDNQAAQGGVSAGSGSPGLSAGSLIDMNNLPGWLRTAEQEPRSGYSSPGAPATFGGSGVYGTPGPTRIENMRVPSRPRAEMAPLEQSEMAANVFSSMLGVASASSAYPLATSSQMGDYPAQQSFQAVQQAPGANQQWPTPAVSPFAQPGQQGAAPNAPAQGFAGAYQPAMQRVEYAAGYGVQNTYGMPAGGVNSPVPSSPYAPPQPGYAPGGSGMGQASGEQRSETAGMKVARRGFLETIRGWFHL
ncbi:MAG TPA: hypothetical protein VGT44_02445, partial [Ktedonobacteraceae bacterium]|nr:hypothetical protein [Ktedonobacteraceae bacterium]